MSARQRIRCLIFLVAFFSLLFLDINNSLSEITVSNVNKTSERKYGAHIDNKKWVHFVVYSPNASEVNLLLFDEADAKIPQHVIPMRKSGGDWRIKDQRKRHWSGIILYVSGKRP